MSKAFRSKTLPVLAAGLVMAALPVFGQGMPVEGPVPTTATITVMSKSGAPLDPAMLTLKVNNQDTPILSVRPVPPPAAQIAILIDDGLRFTFGNQLTDFADFINALPPRTKVLVGYMQNGTVRGMSTFTENHQAVYRHCHRANERYSHQNPVSTLVQWGVIFSKTEDSDNTACVASANHVIPIRFKLGGHLFCQAGGLGAVQDQHVGVLFNYVRIL